MKRLWRWFMSLFRREPEGMVKPATLTTPIPHEPEPLTFHVVDHVRSANICIASKTSTKREKAFARARL